MKEHKTRFFIPVYGNYEICVFVTDNLEWTVKTHIGEANWTKEEMNNVNATAHHVIGELKSYIVLSLSVTVGDIAHESWHVIRRMFRELGVEITKSSNEEIAYPLGYLTDKVNDFYVKHVKRRKGSGRG